MAAGSGAGPSQSAWGQGHPCRPRILPTRIPPATHRNRMNDGPTPNSPPGLLPAGLIAGIVGAVAGTYGGAAARSRLATVFGKDLPAALIEDAVAIL
eukprot:gene47743-58490_t